MHLRSELEQQIVVVIICDIPDDDQLIREIAEMFKKDIDEGNVEEMDDSTRLQLLVPVVL